MDQDSLEEIGTRLHGLYGYPSGNRRPLVNTAAARSVGPGMRLLEEDVDAVIKYVSDRNDADDYLELMEDV